MKAAIVNHLCCVHICARAQVAIVVWAPTGEKFYYSRDDCWKKALRKCGLVDETSVLENVRGLQMNFQNTTVGFQPYAPKVNWWKYIFVKYFLESLDYFTLFNFLQLKSGSAVVQSCRCHLATCFITRRCLSLTAFLRFI